MLISTVKKIFGTRNDRELKRMGKVVARINALEDTMQALGDDELRAKTDEFRTRLGDGETLSNSCQSFCRGQRGWRARSGYAPLRRAAHRGNGAS